MGSRSLRRTQQSRKRLNLGVVASRPRRNSGLLQPGRIPPFGRPGAARHSIRTVTTRTLPGCPTLEISVRLKISSRVSGRAGRLPIGRPATLAHSGRSPGRPTRMKNVRLIVCRVAASPESPPAKGCNLRFCPRWPRAITYNLTVRLFFIRVGCPGDRPECARVAGLPWGGVRPAR